MPKLIRPYALGARQSFSALFTAPRCAVSSVLLFAALAGPVQACTLWGAAGTSSAEGTLLVKNRDWIPDHSQSLRLLKPANGVAYVGLFADGGRSPGIKAGVNQWGLTVVSASASSLSRSVREADRERHGVISALLTRYRSLNEVADHAQEIFTTAKPVFLLLADSTGLMRIEVGQGGRFSLERSSSGTTAHTNHYLDSSLITAQQREGASSSTRLARVDALLAQGPGKGWTLADFNRISQDQNDGPDNSLWRSGHEHTLASWQIALPVQGPARLHLIIANPGQAVLTRDWVLDQTVWNAPAGRLM